MIREIKIGDSVYSGIEEKTVEDGVVTWNVPEDLGEFKAVALDTVNYQAGQSVLSIAGNNAGLSTMNAKSQAVICKLLTPTEAKLDSLTDNEKAAWGIMSGLAEGGYGDSERLVGGLQAVTTAIAKATDKSMRVMQAKTHEEVIAVLNEE